MKSLAQVFIAMAEAGVRLQSDESPDMSRSQQGADAWRRAQSEQSCADAAHGSDQMHASVNE